MYLFIMTNDAALVFFKCVKEFEDWQERQSTEEERVMILTEMAKMGYIYSVMETKRTKEQVIEDAVKNFGNVLHLKNDGTSEILKPEDGDGKK